MHQGFQAIVILHLHSLHLEPTFFALDNFVGALGLVKLRISPLEQVRAAKALHVILETLFLLVGFQLLSQQLCAAVAARHDHLWARLLVNLFFVSYVDGSAAALLTFYERLRTHSKMLIPRTSFFLGQRHPTLKRTQTRFTNALITVLQQLHIGHLLLRLLAALLLAHHHVLMYEVLDDQYNLFSFECITALASNRVIQICFLMLLVTHLTYQGVVAHAAHQRLVHHLQTAKALQQLRCAPGFIQSLINKGGPLLLRNGEQELQLLFEFMFLILYGHLWGLSERSQRRLLR